MKINGNFLEAALEGAEVALDLFTDNEAIKAIPIVGTALKVAKGIDDVRSRILIAKLEKFISEPALRAAAESRALRAELLTDSAFDAKVGDTLFLVLEKVTDLEKPGLLAKLYAAYLDGVIDNLDLLRLMHAVDLAYIDDLYEVLATTVPNEFAEWRQNLVSVGFTVTATGGAWKDDSMITYSLTPLSLKFQKAIEHADTLRPRQST